MPDRRYEVRVTGRLSDVARAVLAADVAEVAAETVISAWYDQTGDCTSS